jgi:hypothetical protein
VAEKAREIVRGCDEFMMIYGDLTWTTTPGYESGRQERDNLLLLYFSQLFKVF